MGKWKIRGGGVGEIIHHIHIESKKKRPKSVKKTTGTQNKYELQDQQNKIIMESAVPINIRRKQNTNSLYKF